jgi:periplasmic divalent cation tolerance protein
MTDGILIFCTCGNQDEARRIAHAMVEERLAACANIITGVQSIFRWEDKVTEAEEVQLLIKTTEHRYPDLQRRIAELHSYDTPEIFSVPLAAVSDKYLAWLRAQV